MAKAISLLELQTRIETLEAEVKKMGEDLVKLTHIKTELKEEKEEKVVKNKPAKAAKGDTLVLLNRLEKAKKAGDKKEAFKVRKMLRKAGYSLRTENGKK